MQYFTTDFLVAALLLVWRTSSLLASVEGSEETQNTRGIRRNDVNPKPATKKNRLLSSTTYELGAPNSRCASAEVYVDNAAECETAGNEMGLHLAVAIQIFSYPHYPCGCLYVREHGEIAHNNCAYGEGTLVFDNQIEPICKVPVADGGGDPHYKMYFDQLVTVQALCDLNLMSSDAYGGVDVHSRHSMPALKKEVEKGYSIISNLALRIGGHTGTVWELIADGPKLFLDGIEFDSFEDDEGITSKTFSITSADHDNGINKYSVQKRVKGQRKNIIEYMFTFTDNSKVVFRGNRHFKMTFVSLHGFSSHSVEGFLGKPDKKGFFDREGNTMTSNKYSLRTKNSKFSIEQFAQEWQVGIDEPNLFIKKSEYPVAPQECLFLAKGSIEGLVDNDYVDTGKNSTMMVSRRRLSEMDEAAVVMAMEACGHLSDDNPKKAFCIDDVIATNEPEIALDTFYEE